jgi:hypothetical protein
MLLLLLLLLLLWRRRACLAKGESGAGSLIGMRKEIVRPARKTRAQRQILMSFP